MDAGQDYSAAGLVCQNSPINLSASSTRSILSSLLSRCACTSEPAARSKMQPSCLAFAGYTGGMAIKPRWGASRSSLNLRVIFFYGKDTPKRAEIWFALLCDSSPSFAFLALSK